MNKIIPTFLLAIGLCWLSFNSQAQQNLSKKLFPFLAAPAPNYELSEKAVVEKFISDSIRYEYRISYSFPKHNVKVVVYSIMDVPITGMMVYRGNEVLANKTFKFASQNVDCPEFAQAADLNNDKLLDYIVRLKNHFGSDFARQIQTNFYAIKKTDAPTYNVTIVGSFFNWEERDLDNDGHFEAFTMDLMSKAQGFVWVMNVFRYENNEWVNDGLVQKYPLFYKFKKPTLGLPKKRDKVNALAVEVYRNRYSMVSFKDAK